MKIEGKTLYINKVDLDHILGYDNLLGYPEGYRAVFTTPPSELFISGLEIELQMNGLEDKEIKKIVIEI